MMLCLERNLLHLCLPTLRADKLMLIQKHKSHMVADANMAQLNMIGVVDLHSAPAAFTKVIVSAVIQIPMKAVGIPTGTGYLFRSTIVYEIDKAIGEKEHVWKICT